MASSEKIFDGRADETSAIADWIHKHLGLGAEQGRFQHVLKVIRQAALHAGSTSITTFLQGLEGDIQGYGRLMERLTVQESYFFRVQEQFRFVRDKVLPAFAAERGRQRVFRAWSAGCARGEEAYSLAILLRESGWLGRSEIIATDVSDLALAQARVGHYRAWAFRSAARWPGLSRYFTALPDEEWTVDPALKSQIQFQLHNLVSNVYPDPAKGLSNLDLILCRNVLIYFSQGCAAQIIARLQHCLAPGGWLILGPSDPLGSPIDGCEMLTTAAGLCYRRLRFQETTTRERTQSKASCARQSRTRKGQVFLEGKAIRAARPARPVSSPESAVDPHRVQALESLSAEEHLERGLQAAGNEQFNEALESFRKALYLDRGLIMAHLNMGAVHEREGARLEAVRAYRNAYLLAASQPADSPLRMANGCTAGEIMSITKAQLQRLGQMGGSIR